MIHNNKLAKSELLKIANDTNNFLSQSIKSILGQTFEKFEFIIKISWSYESSTSREVY